MSKRKQEATRRNQERRAATGRRTPPGYTRKRRGPAFGGRRTLGAAGAVLVVIALGVVLFATNVFGSDKTSGMEKLVGDGVCTERVFAKSTGRAHTTDAKAKIRYTQSDPPTSGRHYQAPPPLMIYDVPVPQSILLHALEHGNIVVQYGKDVSVADRAALRESVLQHRERTLLAPYPKLGKRVVYTAWQRMLSCEGFLEDALVGAQAKWAGTKGVAPEREAFTDASAGVLPGTGW